MQFWHRKCWDTKKRCGDKWLRLIFSWDKWAMFRILRQIESRHCVLWVLLATCPWTTSACVCWVAVLSPLMTSGDVYNMIRFQRLFLVFLGQVISCFCFLFKFCIRKQHDKDEKTIYELLSFKYSFKMPRLQWLRLKQRPKCLN